MSQDGREKAPRQPPPRGEASLQRLRKKRGGCGNLMPRTQGEEFPISTDTRILELEFLSHLSRSEQTAVTLGPGSLHRDMIMHLLIEGMVSDIVGFKMWNTNFDEMARYVIQHTDHQRQLALV